MKYMEIFVEVRNFSILISCKLKKKKIGIFFLMKKKKKKRKRRGASIGNGSSIWCFESLD
jgi:hypothetical protein